MVLADLCAVAFMKKLTPDYYPGITLKGKDLADEEGAAMLDAVYQTKPHLRKWSAPEDGEAESDQKRQRTP